MLNRENQDLAERRLERLISSAPRRVASTIRWIRHPRRSWLRLPLGILFILSSFLFFLPVLGLWMAPLGVILISQDIGPLRRAVYRLINWTAERRPKWFGEQPA